MLVGGAWAALGRLGRLGRLAAWVWLEKSSETGAGPVSLGCSGWGVGWAPAIGGGAGLRLDGGL